MDDDSGFITWRSIRLESVSRWCWASADRRWVVHTYSHAPYFARVQTDTGSIVVDGIGATPHDALDSAALMLAQLAEQIVSTLKQVQ